MNPFYDSCIQETKRSILTLSLMHCVIMKWFNFSFPSYLHVDI